MKRTFQAFKPTFFKPVSILFFVDFWNSGWGVIHLKHCMCIRDFARVISDLN